MADFESNYRRSPADRGFVKSFSKVPAADVAALKPRWRAATNVVMTTLAKASHGSSVVVLVVLAAAGCSSSTGSGTSGTSGGTSGGVGASGECKTGTEAPYASPAGTPMAFPAGVSVEGDIGGNLSGDTKAHCKDADDVEYASDLILACVGLRNSTAGDVTVTFPAGLTFVAKAQETTNGILVHSHDVTVPAGLTYFAFRPASLNQACSPGSATDTYSLGNVTNDAKLLEVLGLAKTKKIHGDIGAAVVGRMIWDITGGSGVTDEHRTQLAAAPDL